MKLDRKHETKQSVSTGINVFVCDTRKKRTKRATREAMKHFSLYVTGILS